MTTFTTHTTTTYEMTSSIREDLEDAIYNVDPHETIYLSSLTRGGPKPKQRYHEWQTDADYTPVSTNAVVEGDDVTTFNDVTPPVRIGAHVQLSHEPVIVSDTMEWQDEAGIEDQLSYDIAKYGLRLRKTIEKSALENIADAAGTVGSTPRVTPGILAYIKTNDELGSGGASPSWTTVPNATRTDGTQRTFVETTHKAVLQAMWTNAGSVEGVMVMLGAYNKTLFSAFSGIASKVINADGSRPSKSFIQAAADVYVSDWGAVTAVPNRLMRARDGLYIKPSACKVLYAKPFEIINLAKSGHSTKKVIRCEWLHQVTNEKALGLAADLTTS